MDQKNTSHIFSQSWSILRQQKSPKLLILRSFPWTTKTLLKESVFIAWLSLIYWSTSKNQLILIHQEKHEIHFCILYSFPKSWSFFFKQSVLTTYTYRQVLHKISSWLNKFQFHSKIFKSGCSGDFAEMFSPPNDTPIFCKFLHIGIMESSEIWRDGSYWLIESCCAVFMGKTYCLELKIEFNDFAVSLRGGWLYRIEFFSKALSAGLTTVMHQLMLHQKLKSI